MAGREEVAALVGGGIGATAGIVGAMAAPIITARANHKRHRREVYVDALATFRQVQSTLHLLLESERPPTSSASWDRIDLYRRGAEIALIGAEKVREQFEMVMGIVRELTTKMDESDVPVHAMGPTDRRPLIELVHHLDIAIGELEDAMRADAEMLM